MTAKSTSGLQVHMNLGSATPSSLTPSGITKAAPAVVTVISTTGLIDGAVVMMADTGFNEIDGKTFIAGAVDATSFELLGSDTVGSSGVLAGAPEANYYTEAMMVLICLATLTMNVNEPGTVSTATFCDPSTSIPSAIQEPGSLALGGFVDIASADYNELVAAEDDGLTRIIRVSLPSNGYLVAPMVVSSLTWDLPLDGAIGYTGTAALGSKLKHVYEVA